MSPDEAHELALIEVSRWQREAWKRMYGLEQDDSVDDDRRGARDGDLDSGEPSRESDGNLPAGRELCDVCEDDTVKPSIAIVGAGMSGAGKALIAAYLEADKNAFLEVVTAQPEAVQELYLDESYMYGEPFDGSGLNVIPDPGKNRKQRRKEAALERRKWRMK